MLTIEFSPPVVSPGGALEVTINTGEIPDIDHINIHVQICGALRGLGYIMWDARRRGPSSFTGQVRLQESQPEGIMEVTSLNLLVGHQGRPQFPGRDFAPRYFKVARVPEELVSQEQLMKEAEALTRARETEFLSGWGQQTCTSTNFDVFVFYRNCHARGGDLFLRKARVFSLTGLGAEDTLNLVDDFFSTRFGILNATSSSRSQISAKFRQGSPCVAILFPRVAAESNRDALRRILPSAFSLSLLLSVDTGTASEFLVAAALNSSGTVEWIFPRQIYRGNMISPFGPNDHFLNKNFELLDKNPDIQFHFALYRDAVAEQNADLAYFRYWTLLESMALARGLKRGERGVEKLLSDHEKKLNMRFGITVNNKHYTVNHCIDVWISRRNITAHFGAFDPNNKRQQQERRSFQIASAASHEIGQARQDFYLHQLREAAKLTLLSSLSSTAGASP